jgi:hypothetical protein
MFWGSATCRRWKSAPAGNSSVSQEYERPRLERRDRPPARRRRRRDKTKISASAVRFTAPSVVFRRGDDVAHASGWHPPLAYDGSRERRAQARQGSASRATRAAARTPPRLAHDRRGRPPAAEAPIPSPTGRPPKCCPPSCSPRAALRVSRWAPTRSGWARARASPDPFSRFAGQNPMRAACSAP